MALQMQEHRMPQLTNGEFVLVCGPSAGGKTTFLNELRSNYEKNGIKTGFVMQNFDAQIVTDRVWHELTFALENTGTSRSVMHRRVAEVCSYFGISEWLLKDTAFLSGGQKQLVNLASVMAMTPQVLILDEPTSQLDPVTAQNFLSTVRRLNLELGITVVIAEHRLEELFPVSDRVLFIENMKCLFDGTPADLCREKKIFDYLPCAARLALNNGEVKDIPVSIRDGRRWLTKRLQLRDWSGAERPEPSMAVTDVAGAKPRKARPAADARTDAEGKPRKKIIECKKLTFGYEKGHDVLCQMDFDLKEGEIFAGVGANGSGKSTFLKLLCGLLKPASGKIKIEKGKSVFLMSQNVRNIFTGRTAREELEECGWNGTDGLSVFDRALSDRHPYDLSGGEMQKLALEKILLKKPDIILLDEPTKALDNAFKKELSGILKKLAERGISIVLVCHDLEFCAYTADRVSMFFEGQLSESESPREFFSGNNFYTTGVNRICRGLIDDAVTDGDVVL
jgi:energy-coupling factor transport system ATP-binding protein